MQHRYETHRKWNTGVFGGAMAAIWLAVFTLPALAQEQPEFATDSEGKPCQVISYTSYEITKPGRYCLTHDIFVQWNGEPLTAPIRMAILIRASDVVLDLNGFTIGYRQAHPLVSSTGGPGITQTINVLKNVVIRNGKISRFRTGVELRLSSQALMEGIQKDWRHSLEESNQSYITIEEISFEDNKVDVYLFGRNLTLHRNKFLHTGLSERQREDWSGNPIGQPKRTKEPKKNQRGQLRISF